MVIRIKSLGGFLKLDLLSKIYIIVFLIVMFSGSTFIKDIVPILILLLISILILKILFNSKNALRSKDLIPFLLNIIFVLFLFWQTIFIAYEQGIAWVYVKRYFYFSFILLFIPCTDIIFYSIKGIKFYSFLVAFSIVISTAITGYKAGGLVGDYQSGGMMMSISCFMFMIEYFNEEKNNINIFGIILSFLGLFISGKRMFTLIAIMFFGLSYIFATDEKKNIKLIKALCIISVSSFLFFNYIPAAKEIIFRIISLAGNKQSITSGRNVLWEKALDIFDENSLYGIGFGSYQKYFYDYFEISGISAFLTHNIYYGLLCETGIIGFSIYMFLIIYMLIKTLGIWKKIKTMDNKKYKYICNYALFMQIWFIVYGYTGNGIYDANETFFYFTSIGMILSLDNTLKKENIDCYANRQQ